MNIFLKIFFFYIVLSLFSCANKVVHEDQRLGVEYYVRYLEPEGKIRVEATFYERDSLRKKKIEVEKVYFQEEPLNVQALRAHGSRYQFEQKSAYPEMFNFKFIDNQGKSHLHESKMDPILLFSLRDRISKTQDMTLQWEGAPLLQGESIVLLFSDKEEKVVSYTHKGPTTTNTIQIPGKSINELSNGEGKLYLVKKRLFKAFENKNYVQTLTEFYTKFITIDIKE